MAGYYAYNWYGNQTTRDNIYSAAYGNGHTYSIVFYIGHGWTYYEQQWFITDDGGEEIYDKNIFPYSTCGNVKFVLLWSCRQGDTIGGTHLSGTPFGMPYAWLHTTSLSSDGYANPDNGGRAFIGFQGVAPFLTYDGLGAPKAGFYFLLYFYWAAIYRGRYYSIKSALDYAAQMVWGDSTGFEDCILRTGYSIDGYSGKMVVYGDGNMHISDYAGSG